jgi:hypothetical protein
MTLPGALAGNSIPPDRRRWLLGLEPIFEGGWLHKGKLVALSVLGDVTVDLSDTKSAPAEVVLKAFALGRDVDVYVAPGTHVELSGRRSGHLHSDVPAVDAARCDFSVHIEGHAFLGDVTVRIAPAHR